MPFVPVADTVEVELFQRLHGQEIENTQYWRLDGGLTTGAVIDLWNNLLVWWTTTFSTPLSGDLTLHGGKFTDLSSETGFSLDFNAPTPNPSGGDPSPALPGNAAITVSFRTPNRGRSFRWRNYVAGLPESQVTGNTVSLAVTTALQAAYTQLLSLPLDDPWEWVVVSRVADGAPRVTGVATAITSATVVDQFVDSQRRRLTGRGN